MQADRTDEVSRDQTTASHASGKPQSSKLKQVKLFGKHSLSHKMCKFLQEEHSGSDTPWLGKCGGGRDSYGLL